MALRFVGIGAAKCATTWTYLVLDCHPQVHFPAGKEVNFWTKPAPRDMVWYDEMMVASDATVISGEISVSYVHLSVESIRQLQAYAPDVRLFMNVRHPVDRAWSRAKMLIRQQGATLADLSDEQLMESVFGRKNIQTGDYAATLDRWLSVFPAEQMLITQFDDVAMQPAVAIERLQRHLGVGVDQQVASALQNPQPTTTENRPLPGGIRDMLAKLYDEPTRRLRDQYDIDYTGPGRY